jgi:cytochrome c oxidase subunit 2
MRVMVHLRWLTGARRRRVPTPLSPGYPFAEFYVFFRYSGYDVRASDWEVGQAVSPTVSLGPLLRTAVHAGLGALDPQGPVSRAMASLWWLMLGLGVLVFAVFAGMLAVGLLRRRRATGPRPDEGRHAFGRWFVVGGVVAPAVILAVVFVATVLAMRSVPTTAAPDALVVEIVGHQYFWEVRYPDEGIMVRDELHIPVGRQVALRLTSADVIHSFWVPELGGKMDLLPDRTNTLVLQADEPGEHRSRCAEFCGLHHATMVLTVVAEPQERFASWVADRRG